MAEQTVKQQLVEALERLVDIHENPTHYPLDIQKSSYQRAQAALDRARAEPECGDAHGPECPCYQDGANESHSSGCNDDSCACWAAGHETGLGAQRERVGGGMA